MRIHQFLNIKYGFRHAKTMRRAPMNDFVFNLEEYRLQLTQMKEGDLIKYFGQISPEKYPRQRLAVSEELVRRGVSNVYATASVPVAAKKQKLAFPVGLKLGCMGCGGGIALYAVILIVSFTQIGSIMPGFICNINGVSGKESAVVVYDHIKFGFNNDENTKKSYAAMINKGNITYLPAPPCSSSEILLSGNNRVLLACYSEWFSLALNPEGKSIGDNWSPHKLNERENKNIAFRNDEEVLAFTIGGVPHILKKSPSSQSEDSDSETEETSFDVYSVETGEPADSSLIAGLRDIILKLDGRMPEKIMETSDLIFSFWRVKDADNGSNKLLYSLFDGNEWSKPQRLLSDIYYNLAFVSDGNSVYVFYKENAPITKSIFRQMKEASDTMRRVEALKLTRNEISRLPDVKMDKFDVSPVFDGERVFILTSGAMGRDKDIWLWELNENEWKIVAKNKDAFKLTSIYFSPPMLALTGVAFLSIVLMVLIGSRMVAKDRGTETMLAGRLVKVPTLARRFAALLIDWSLFYPLLYAVYFYIFNKNFSEFVPSFFDNRFWALCLVWPAFALAMFVYFVVSEGCFGGRTLGKKLMGLRVVREDLSPCSPGAAALRFILKIVDSPGFYLIGAIVTAHTKKFQRVGDLAAKTVVVIDEPGLLKPSVANEDNTQKNQNFQ